MRRHGDCGSRPTALAIGTSSARRCCVLLLLIVLLLAGCAAEEPARVPAPTTPDPEQRFLAEWLVDRNLVAARKRFATDFDSRPEGDLSSWPERLRPLSRSERALRLPFELQCVSACDRIDACTTSLEREEIVIDENHARQYSDLQRFDGRSGTHVTYGFRGCGYGAVLIFTDDGTLQFVGYSPPA